MDTTILQDFLTYSLDLICILDSEGIFQILSRAWETTLGYSTDDLKNKSFFDLVHPDDIPKTTAMIEQLTFDNPILHHVNRYCSRDGGYRLMEWHIQRRNHFIYASARDITESKKIEDALQESELRYRTVVTAMSEGIVLQGSDGSIQACNHAAEIMLGLTADQMMGRTSIDPRWSAIHEDGSVFPGETHPAMVTLKTGKPQSHVVMGVHKPDGNLTWILINTQPIFHSHSSLPDAVVASFTDITQLKKISEALQESERRFRTISEMISNYTYGFLVLEDGNLKHEWTAGAFETITGYTPPELAKLGGWAKIIYSEDMLITQKRAERLLKGQESIDEFRIITKSGEIRWLRDYARPIKDKITGRVTSILGAAQDLTEHKLAEQQKLELATERERIKLISDFITTTSHELRTPLSIINTSLYLLMNAFDDERRQFKATQIHEQVNYLDKVISQLHEIIRLDQLNELELKPSSIKFVIDTFMDVYKPQKPTVIMPIIVPDLPMILANHFYLQQILENLVDNAVRFSSENSLIRIIARSEGKWVIVEVADVGEGIPPDHLELIFNPFHKVNTARTIGNQGIGMGLSIVKRIMELHHGKVKIHSQIGEGTIVSLYFPIDKSG